MQQAKPTLYYTCKATKHVMDNALCILQLINQTVLSNRRAYADLYSRLMMADIEREKLLHVHWKNRVEDWRQLHTELAVDNFKYVPITKYDPMHVVEYSEIHIG